MRVGISLEKCIVSISKLKLQKSALDNKVAKIDANTQANLRHTTERVLLRNYVKMFLSKKPKTEILDLIEKLRNEGDTIYIVSNQNSVDISFKNKLNRSIIQSYLSKSGIKHDGIAFAGEGNISDICERNDIDVYLEKNNFYQVLAPKSDKNISVDSPCIHDSLNGIRNVLNHREKSEPYTGVPSIDRVYDQYYTNKEKAYGIPKMSMYQYMYSRNMDQLDEVAIKYFDNSFTYREFFKKIDDCAKSLLESGIVENTVVTVSMPNVPETAILFYALNKIGAVAHMMDPRTPAEELKNKVNQVGSKMLFFIDSEPTTKTLANIDLKHDTSIEKAVFISPKNSMPKLLKTLYTLFEQGKHVHIAPDNFYMHWQDFSKMGEQYEGVIPNVYNENQGSIIINTGGTTGTSKGAVLPNEYYNALVSRFRASKELIRQREVLTILPAFHIFGLGAAFHIVLSNGVKVDLMPKFSPKALEKTLKKGKTNYIICVPQILNFMRNNNKIRVMNLECIEYVVVGGDNITSENEKTFNEFLEAVNSKITLSKGYGLTEGGIVIISKAEGNELGSIGIPTVNTDIKMVNPETCKEVGYNENGEICLTGPIMLEYFNNIEETDLVIRTHDDGKKWLHTGDMGYINENGIIYFADRLKQIIISNGINIYPSEIESVIMEHSTVKECVVVGIPHKVKGRVPKAHIILKDGIIPSHEITQQIESLCKEKLAPFANPQNYQFRDSYPLTLLNKVNRKQLEAEDSIFEVTIEPSKQFHIKKRK